MVANAAIDLVIPPKQVTAKPAEEAPATAYALAATTSVPVDFAPTKVKTIPMLFREAAGEEPVAARTPAERIAAVPLPRPRPASAPGAAMALASADANNLISRQPGSMAISAATRKGAPDDGEVLGPAGIERMKTALALTAEQEEYWPAIAAELRTLGKVVKTSKGQNISLDDDTVQRLYWVAAPLISRLSYEQKQKVKQMAHVMGLHQVAQAL
jgi:hypothetical protein